MISTLSRNILLENGIIYDPCKDKKKNGSILIKDGIIKEVGKCSIPKNVKKIILILTPKVFQTIR